MNPLMLTATSVLRSLQRISKWDLLSLEVSAAETSGLSSSGDFSSVISQSAPALFVVRLGAGRIGRGYINLVVAFQSLAIVLDLTAEPERFLGVRAGGKKEAGAGDDQSGAHFREQGWSDPAGTLE